MSPITFHAEGIGTKWQVDILDDIDHLIAQDIWKQIEERIELYDKTYSRFRPDSLITKINERAGVYKLPEEADKLLDIYRKLYNLTNGLFTPLIGQTLVDAGYDSTYSLKHKPVIQAPPAWDDVMEYKDRVLKCTRPVLLDFGAGGKGQLIDLVTDILIYSNIRNATVDASGDIRHLTSHDKQLRIGLEHPQDFDKIIGVVNIANESICASAGSRRKWGDFHHIINPRTLRPPLEVIATWVIAKQALIADALATALFFTHAQRLLPAADFEYLILKNDFSYEKSSGFNAELYF